MIRCQIQLFNKHLSEALKSWGYYAKYISKDGSDDIRLWERLSDSVTVICIVFCFNRFEQYRVFCNLEWILLFAFRARYFAFRALTQFSQSFTTLGTSNNSSSYHFNHPFCHCRQINLRKETGGYVLSFLDEIPLHRVGLICRSFNHYSYLLP